MTPKETSAPGAGPRESHGTGAGSHRHPPHLDVNSADAPVQESTQAPNDVPVLPANASGQDARSVEPGEGEIRKESMYNDRPEEDKDYRPDKPLDEQ